MRRAVAARWRLALVVCLPAACGLILLAWLAPANVAGWLLLTAFCG